MLTIQPIWTASAQPCIFPTPSHDWVAELPITLLSRCIRLIMSHSSDLAPTMESQYKETFNKYIAFFASGTVSSFTYVSTPWF